MANAPQGNVLPDNLVWRAAGFDPDSYRGVHALAPISLGLALPALALLILVPEMVNYWALMLSLYLMIIFVLSGVIFVRSIFRSEDVAEVRLDKAARTVSVTRKGSFGNTVSYIPFDKVSDAYFNVRYDDDGYKVSEPRLRLKNGEELDLPGEAGAADLAAVRKLLASG